MNETDVSIIVHLLAESVSARLRENNFLCNVVEISVRDNGLESFTRQKKVTVPTDITKEIADSAMELFRFHYNWRKPIRSLGVRASSLSPANTPWQISMFTDPSTGSASSGWTKLWTRYAGGLAFTASREVSLCWTAR